MSDQPNDVRRQFWALVERGPAESCWEWKGRRGWYGYGVVKGDIRAHCLAYELTYGPIPLGMVVRQTCDNRPCCNPSHLLLLTRSQAAKDMIARGRLKLCPNPNISRGRPPGKLDEEKRQAIQDAYARGATLKELAATYDVHWSSISRAIHGRRPRGVKRKLTLEQAEAMRKRYRDEGLKPSKLSLLFGISESATRLILGGKQYRS
jgi:transposase-like protein